MLSEPSVQPPCAKIDFLVDDEWAPLVQFLRRLEPVLLSPAQRPGSVDLRACAYFGPFATAVLGAQVKYNLLAKRRLHIELPEGPPQLLNYTRYSGLKHWIGAGAPPDPDHPDSETVPLTSFHAVLWGLASDVVRLISRHIEISPDEEDALQLCFTEVGQNIADHARSPVGGIFAARYIAQRRRIRVAIVDRGDGIAATLVRQHPSLGESRAAIDAVLKGGVSARTLSRNRGLGVSHLRETVVRMGGELVLASGDAAVHVGAGGAKRWANPGVRYPGTAIFFVLPVSDSSSGPSGRVGA